MSILHNFDAKSNYLPFNEGLSIAVYAHSVCRDTLGFVVTLGVFSAAKQECEGLPLPFRARKRFSGDASTLVAASCVLKSSI